MNAMIDELIDAFQYGVDSLDKLGPRPVRGLLGGKPREALSFLPFSDAAGITDPRDIRTGRNVTDYWNLTNPGDTGMGASAAGMLADLMIDPLALAGGATAAFRGARGLHRGLLSASKGLARHPTAFSLGLPFDELATPPGNLRRFDPEWVNQKTFYHGSTTPGLDPAALDPLKTKGGENLFGHGIYTSGDESLGREYLDKAQSDILNDSRRMLNDRALREQVRERAGAGDFRDYIAKHAGYFQDEASNYHAGPGPVPSPLDWSSKQIADELMRGARNYVHAKSYNPGELAPHMEEAFRLVVPEHTIPKPVLYQAQSDFGKILDVERPLGSSQYNEIHEALKSAFGHHGIEDLIGGPLLKGGSPEAPEDLIRFAKSAGPKELLRVLKSLGYDALTHTGGQIMGDKPHQVVIGLDPNDVLGLGRKTPYKTWEPFHARPL